MWYSDDFNLQVSKNLFLLKYFMSKLHSYKMYISNQINSEMLEPIIYDRHYGSDTFIYVPRRM